MWWTLENYWSKGESWQDIKGKGVNINLYIRGIPSSSMSPYLLFWIHKSWNLSRISPSNWVKIPETGWPNHVRIPHHTNIVSTLVRHRKWRVRATWIKCIWQKQPTHVYNSFRVLQCLFLKCAIQYAIIFKKSL